MGRERKAYAAVAAPRRPRPLAAFICVVLVMAVARPARAIDIQLVYDDLGENPTWDASGTALMAIAQAAAQIWEDLLPQSGTYTVDVSWSELDDGQLGLWKGDVGNDNTYFNSNKPWFIDTTPFNHDEYQFGGPFDLADQFGSVLFGHDTNAPNYFNGTPPDALEIAYRGVAPEGGTARDRYDLLSVILHEFGHELGVNDDPFSTIYPIYPQHILGVAGIEALGADDVDHEDGDAGHLGAPISIMSGFGLGQNERRLPSALDVLTVAYDESFTTVDLDRKYFGQGSNWNNGGNWIGGSVPNFDDDAYLIDGHQVGLSGLGRARKLFIGNFAALQTNANTLEVSGLTHLADCALCLGEPAPQLVVETGGTADLHDLFMHHQALLEMAGGTLAISGVADIGEDGTSSDIDEVAKDSARIRGYGEIDISGFMHVQGSTRGRIDVENGTLRLVGSGALELDGDLNARDGDLELGVRIDDSSTGNINVGKNHNLTILNDLALKTHLKLSSGSDVLGANSGVDLRITDRMSVDAEPNDGSPPSGIETASVVFLSMGEFSHFIGAPLELRSSTTHFRGVRFSGDGILRQRGDITVGIDNEQLDTFAQGDVTTIDTDTFDWGNSSAFNANVLRINAGATLLINADSTGSAGNGYSGDIIVNSGTLNVNFIDGWRLQADPPFPLGAPGGRLFLQNIGSGTPTLRGTALTVANFLTASGGLAVIQAPLIVAPGGVVNVQTGAEMEWRGPVTLAGGDVNGAGRIEQRDDITVTADTTVSPGEFAWGLSGSITQPVHKLSIEDGATLRITADTGTAGNPYRGLIELNGGRLQYFTGGTWTLPAEVPGAIPLLTQRGGELIMRRQNGHSSSIEGDKLVVHGGITVFDPSAELSDEVDFHPDAQVEIAAGASLALDGLATFFGGQFHGAGRLAQGGDIVIAGDTSIDVGTFDWGNSNLIEAHQLTINPGATLTVNANSLGGAGNPFNGTLRIDRGELVVNTPDGWSLPTASGFLNSGVLDMRAGGGVNPRLAGADLAVSNLLIVTGGTAEIDNHVSLLAGGRVTILTNSTLRVDGALTFTPGALAQGSGRIGVSASGALHGGGAVGVDVSLSGLLDPSLGGAEVGLGRMTFADDLLMLPTATLAIDLGATDYDRVQVADSAFLSGTLDVDLVGGFNPQSGDIFDIFTAQALQGSFDELLFPLLALGLEWQLDYLFDVDLTGLDLVRLSVTGEAAPVPLPSVTWLSALLVLPLLRGRRRRPEFAPRFTAS